eukprot:5637453-Prymnesium_polylepis.1
MSSAPSGASKGTSPTARTGAGGGAAALMSCSTSQRRLSSAHCALYSMMPSEMRRGRSVR